MRLINAPCAEREAGGQGLSASGSGSLLAVDIGNTNIVCGFFDETELRGTVRLQSDPHRSADEYYALLMPTLSKHGFVSADHAVIASVVPELTRMWQHLFQRHFNIYALVVNALSPIGLRYKVADPSFIGADLVANALAAWKKYRRGVIIIDLGTATTVQFVSSQGVFEGSAIIPGMKTGARNLFDKAALLSDIEISTPPALIGTNTRDALLSGIVNSHAFLLEAYVQKLKLLYFDHKNIVTILTGGMAELLKPLMTSVDFVDKTLTLEGLRLAHEILNGREPQINSDL